MDDEYGRTRYVPKSEREAEVKKLPSMKKQAVNCESCEYFDYDEDADCNVCRMNLDEDEMVLFLSGSFRSCPYYKFYDEYKSVHKQI